AMTRRKIPVIVSESIARCLLFVAFKKPVFPGLLWHVGATCRTLYSGLKPFWRVLSDMRRLKESVCQAVGRARAPLQLHSIDRDQLLARKRRCHCSGPGSPNAPRFAHLHPHLVIVFAARALSPSSSRKAKVI
ncbi:hypothetical protein, partial [Sinorhizobium americanum]|uniref:hypothetical protein n=1 Tax=Sinorhizobium americanum TaxID=194963 RepID=UPI001A9F33FA